MKKIQGPPEAERSKTQDSSFKIQSELRYGTFSPWVFFGSWIFLGSWFLSLGSFL